MSERPAVARPRRSSIVLAHLLPLVALMAGIAAVEGRQVALQTLPVLGTLFGLGLLLNLSYWGWNAVDAADDGLIEVICGHDCRKVAWEDIVSATYLGGPSCGACTDRSVRVWLSRPRFQCRRGRSSTTGSS
jgi:hypothetical protein